VGSRQAPSALLINRDGNGYYETLVAATCCVVLSYAGRPEDARYGDALEQLGLDPAETERSVQAFARSLPNG
jgi:hypothetical protein